MHKTIQNLIDIQKKINLTLDTLKINKIPKIIAVSKTFGIDKILPLIEHGHLDFGENKVQEAVEKWSDVKLNNNNIITFNRGLQTNKVKLAVKFLIIFIQLIVKNSPKKYLMNNKNKKKVKIFIQVNIGNEEQKSGVNKSSIPDLYSYCKALKLDVVGLMCIPPLEKSSDFF